MYPFSITMEFSARFTTSQLMEDAYVLVAAQPRQALCLQIWNQISRSLPPSVCERHTKYTWLQQQQAIRWQLRSCMLEHLQEPSPFPLQKRQQDGLELLADCVQPASSSGRHWPLQPKSNSRASLGLSLIEWNKIKCLKVKSLLY